MSTLHRTNNLFCVVWLIAIASQLSLIPVAQQNERKVVVDNSYANNAIEGRVTDGNPNRARIVIKNLNNFWTNIVIQQPIGEVQLKPANPLSDIKDIGGIYATINAIAPEQEVVWFAEFDAKKYAAQTILVTPTIKGSDGKTLAFALNELSIIASLAGKVIVTKSAQKITKAVEIAMGIEDFAGLLQALENDDFLSFSEHFYNLLSDENKRIYLAEALAQLDVVVSSDSLKEMVEIIGFVEVPIKVWDITLAIIRQNESGTVTFSVPPAIAVAVSPLPSTKPTTNTPVNGLIAHIGSDGNVYLGNNLLLNVSTETPACFNAIKVVYSHDSWHFVVIVNCFEGDNELFLFNADGTGKLRITGKWDYVNYCFFDWDPSGEAFVYSRVNSSGASEGQIPVNAPPVGTVRYDVTTGEEELVPDYRPFISRFYRVIDVVNNDRLNVRSQPNPQSTIVGTIPPDASEIEANSAANGADWIYITYEGVSGWVRTRFLEVIPSKYSSCE